jgi:hypothetical protein
MAKFRQTMNNIRVDAVNELIGIMKKHNRKEVETYSLDGTPTVIEKPGVNVIFNYTLDAIKVVDGKEPYLIFSCSSYDCEDVTSNDVTIYNLVNILSWVLSNEEWLFENEDY